MSTVYLPTVDALEKLAQGQSEGSGQSRQMAKPDLACSPFQIGDVNLMDSRLLGQIDLPPTSPFPEFSYSFADLETNIRGHSPSIDLVEALYLVDALCGFR